MLSFASHQRNVNKNKMSYQLTPIRMNIIKKIKITNAGKDLKDSYTLWWKGKLV